MRPIILVCIAVFSAVMLIVKFTAHQIVGNFGVAAGVAVIAAMLGAAYLYDQRASRR